MRIDLVAITWDRAFRIFWALWWRCTVTALTIALLAGLMADVPFSSVFEPRRAEGSAATAPFLARFLWFALITLIPLRMILGRDFGDFRVALIREHREADPTTPRAPWWHRRLGGVFATGVIGSAIIREYWRHEPQSVLILVGVPAGIAAAYAVARWLLGGRERGAAEQ